MIARIKPLLQWIEQRLPPFMGGGRWLHFTLCLLPSIVGLYGAAFALGLAFGKECGDYFNEKSKWDWWDIVADGLGIIVGLLSYHYIFS